MSLAPRTPSQIDLMRKSGRITASYIDNSGGTTRAFLTIWDWHGALQTTASFENSDWSFDWDGGGVDNSYVVEFAVDHENVDNFAENRVVMALTHGGPTYENESGIENILGNPSIGESNIPLVSLVVFGMIGFGALVFSASYSGIGMIFTGITSLGFVWLRWLDLPGGAGLPIFIIALGGLWKLTEGKE